MTRQSKNAKNMARARQFAKLRVGGGSGPKATTPLHNKRWGYRNNPEVLKRQEALAKSSSKKTFMEKLKDGDSLQA